MSGIVATEARLAILDASVAVKWFVTDNEDGVDEALALLASHKEAETRLIGPALLAYELLSALRKRSDSPKLTDAMDGFHDAGVFLVPPDRELMTAAARICVERGTSASDAAYAALAQLLDAELVTADRRLAAAFGDACLVRVI
jgi:predicted nucleic acid-binding protein